METKRPGARELARRAMRAQVAEMAFELFVERGYEETTVDDICEVAGISRSTFFRYFATKEAVLTGEGENLAERVLTELRERPDDENPWTALGRASTPLLDHYGADPQRRLRMLQMVRDSPAVLANHQQEKAPHWQTVLGPELARRLGIDADDRADPRPAALVAALLGCLEAAGQAWAASGGEKPLSHFLERAMSVIGPAA